MKRRKTNRVEAKGGQVITFDGETITECDNCGKRFRVPL